MGAGSRRQRVASAYNLATVLLAEAGAEGAGFVSSKGGG